MEFYLFWSFEIVSSFAFCATSFFLGAPFDFAQDMLCAFARDIPILLIAASPPGILEILL